MIDAPKTYRLKGIISADRACESCGNTNLKKNVILEDAADGSLLYVGTTCAGYLLLGDKSRKNSALTLDYAKGIEYAAKWTAKLGTAPATLRKIADAVRVRFCPCDVKNGAVVIRDIRRSIAPKASRGPSGSKRSSLRVSLS
jgi:hypothetical protein